MTRLAARLAPTGALRGVINLGNPVLAQGTPDEPRGVTVALARAFADWLGVPLAMTCVDMARDAYAAIGAGEVDLCFLADEPDREEHVVFTAPYVVIEGVFVTHLDRLASAGDVDAAGVRIGARRGSAYDLFLRRTLERAEVVAADDPVEVYERQGLEAAAGIRQPMTQYAARTGRRVVEPAFMEIRQAVGLPRTLDADAVAAVAAKVEELKASGMVAAEIARSGVQASVAPPAA